MLTRRRDRCVVRRVSLCLAWWCRSELVADFPRRYVTFLAVCQRMRGTVIIVVACGLNCVAPQISKPPSDVSAALHELYQFMESQDSATKHIFQGTARARLCSALR